MLGIALSVRNVTVNKIEKLPVLMELTCWWRHGHCSSAGKRWWQLIPGYSPKDIEKLVGSGYNFGDRNDRIYWWIGYWRKNNKGWFQGFGAWVIWLMVSFIGIGKAGRSLSMSNLRFYLGNIEIEIPLNYQNGALKKRVRCQSGTKESPRFQVESCKSWYKMI